MTYIVKVDQEHYLVVNKRSGLTHFANEDKLLAHTVKDLMNAAYWLGRNKAIQQASSLIQTMPVVEKND